MNASKRTSEDGLDLIREFEGLRLEAYPDPGTGAEPWTIGYGHTGDDVFPGMRITRAEADALLRGDVQHAEDAVRDLVRVPLAQHQFDALVSFCFNCGRGAFAKSTLLRKLNTGDFDAVPTELARWTRAAGKVLPGLVRRRKAEAALWVGYEGADTDRAKPEAPSAKPMSSSRTMQGAALSGIGTTGAVITESAQQLAPAAEGFEVIKLVCALLLVAGIVLTIYGRLRIAREEGV